MQTPEVTELVIKEQGDMADRTKEGTLTIGQPGVPPTNPVIPVVPTPPTTSAQPKPGESQQPKQPE